MLIMVDLIIKVAGNQTYEGSVKIFN